MYTITLHEPLWNYVYKQSAKHFAYPVIMLSTVIQYDCNLCKSVQDVIKVNLSALYKRRSERISLFDLRMRDWYSSSACENANDFCLNLSTWSKFLCVAICKYEFKRHIACAQNDPYCMK